MCFFLIFFLKCKILLYLIFINFILIIVDLYSLGDEYYCYFLIVGYNVFSCIKYYKIVFNNLVYRLIDINILFMKVMFLLYLKKSYVFGLGFCY